MEDVSPEIPESTIERLSSDLTEICCTQSHKDLENEVYGFWLSVNNTMNKARKGCLENPNTERNIFGTEKDREKINSDRLVAEKYFKAMESLLFGVRQASAITVNEGGANKTLNLREIEDRYLAQGNEHRINLQSGVIDFCGKNGGSFGTCVEVANGKMTIIQDGREVLSLFRKRSESGENKIVAVLPIRCENGEFTKIIAPIPYGVIQHGLLWSDTMPIGVLTE